MILASNFLVSVTVYAFTMSRRCDVRSILQRSFDGIHSYCLKFPDVRHLKDLDGAMDVLGRAALGRAAPGRPWGGRGGAALGRAGRGGPGEGRAVLERRAALGRAVLPPQFLWLWLGGWL